VREDSDRSAESSRIDHKALPDLGLMFHDPMAGMHDDAGDEDHIGHCLSQIAARHTKRPVTVFPTHRECG